MTSAVFVVAGCAVAPPSTGIHTPAASLDVSSASPQPSVLPSPDETIPPPMGVFPPPSASAQTPSASPQTPASPQSPAAPSTPATPPPTSAPPTSPPVKTVDCRKHKCVALTFDDGPAASTADILTLLSKEKVHATFFLIGQNAKARPDLVKRMAAEGNAVGNHSYSHPHFSKMKAERIRDQLATTSTLIENATGVKVSLMRPPYGESNKTIRSVEKELGLSQILWNIDPEDWRNRDSKVIAKRVVDKVRPGSIVLSHDIYPTTVKAYKTIIPALKKKGYVFVTVPELLGHVKPGVNYSELR